MAGENRRCTAARLLACAVFAFALLWPAGAAAQYVPPYVVVTGALSGAGGIAAGNATLTFVPSQVFFVGGTSVVVGEAQCATDVSGIVVSIGNPVSGPRVSPQYTGSLPAGNYYVVFTWYDQFGGQTLASPEVAQTLSAAGELQILPPVGAGPPNAMGMNVYIGTAPGTETYQGHTTSPTALYTQASALTTGAVPSPANTTACRVVANDSGWPTGTGYNVSLTDASGNTLFSYPELWQFLGAGSTYNLSNGIPYYHGQVTYPTPVLTIPLNHNLQSISGPINMTNYPVVNVSALGVGTSLPAWGVDVEGSGLGGAVNAATGYLVNGAGGTAGWCLGSDGTYWDMPIQCLTSALTLYYQTILNNGVAQTQEPLLNILPPLVAGPGGGGRTQIALPVTGTQSEAVTASAAGVSGNCMQWNGSGGAGDAGEPCALPPYTGGSGYQGLGNGLIFMWGSANAAGGGPTATTVSFPTTCTTFEKVVGLATVDYGANPSRNVAYLTAESLSGFTVQTDSSTVAVNWEAICK
jgi:hypothetical protein